MSNPIERATVRNLADYIAGNAPMLPFFKEIARNSSLEPFRDSGGHLKFHASGKGLDPQWRQFLENIFHHCGREIGTGIALYLTSKLFTQGIRTFRPTLEECLALEEIEVKLPMADYAQPFPTFCVEFPSAYAQIRTTVGKGPSPDFLPNLKYQPVLQILHHDPTLRLLLCNTITSYPGMCLTGAIGSPDSRTLEDDMNKRLVGGEDVTDDELVIERRCTRLALNACLMLMANGCRRKPDGDSYRAALEAKIAKNRKGKGAQHLESNERQLAQLPIVYGFDQQISVRRLTGDSSACTGAETGDRRVHPHWRRAHWRMQRVGVGLLQTRRTLIPHTMVNRDRFGGDEAETSTTYS